MSSLHNCSCVTIKLRGVEAVAAARVDRGLGRCGPRGNCLVRCCEWLDSRALATSADGRSRQGNFVCGVSHLCADIGGVHIYRQTAGERYTQHLAESALGLSPSVCPCNCRPQQHIHTRWPASDLSRAPAKQGLGRLRGHADNVWEIWSRPNKSRLGLGSRPRDGTHSPGQPTVVIVNARSCTARHRARIPATSPAALWQAKSLALVASLRHDIESHRAV